MSYRVTAEDRSWKNNDTIVILWLYILYLFIYIFLFRTWHGWKWNCYTIMIIHWSRAGNIILLSLLFPRSCLYYTSTLNIIIDRHILPYGSNTAKLHANYLSLLVSLYLYIYIYDFQSVVFPGARRIELLNEEGPSSTFYGRGKITNDIKSRRVYYASVWKKKIPCTKDISVYSNLPTCLASTFPLTIPKALALAHNFSAVYWP